jgi:hypothetical protein
MNVIWFFLTDLSRSPTIGFLSLSVNEKPVEGLSRDGSRGGSSGVEVFFAGVGAWCLPHYFLVAARFSGRSV